MVQLPEVWVKPSKPFTSSGVDYSGPFCVKQGGKRSRTTVKCYVALFVCLATKAVHLELVSELSTEAYIGSLQRYIDKGYVLTFTVTMVLILWELRRNWRKSFLKRNQTSAFPAFLLSKESTFTSFPLVLHIWVVYGKLELSRWNFTYVGLLAMQNLPLKNFIPCFVK